LGKVITVGGVVGVAAVDIAVGVTVAGATEGCHRPLPERLAQIFEKDHERDVPDEKSTRKNSARSAFGTQLGWWDLEGTVRCWAPCHVVPLGGIGWGS
jgi:predicted RecA/RadA family phage recombinase